MRQTTLTGANKPEPDASGPMGRLIKALANAGHPVKSGPTATGKFTGATIFQRPLQTPIDRVLGGEAATQVKHGEG
eukprot:COSAG03_NODE_3671_length_1886_cov_16.155568_4_plen_76_part_00